MSFSSRYLALLPLTLFLAPLAVSQTTYPYIVTTLTGVNPLGDNGPATAALLESPSGVAVDDTGAIYIGDSDNARIRVVGAGKISTAAFGVAVDLKTDSAGNLYAADGVYKIYKISPAGVITVIAGAGFGFSGDGGPATAARFAAPSGVAIDSKNNIYIADTLNNRIRKITPDGIINTIAGNGVAAYSIDNIKAEGAPLAYPWGIVVDSTGNIFFSELYRVRKVSTAGIITTVAGYGSGAVDGLAINSAIGSTAGLAIDSANNVYLADSDFNMVRMITGSGVISTLAGTGAAGYSGDGSFAFRATLNDPISVAVDLAGNVYVADRKNHRIRRITPGGTISTIAGGPHFGGDGAPAASALIHRPEHAVTDSNSNLYISDAANNRIRKVTPAGVISTFAGNGDCGFAGDRGPAINAAICSPRGLAFDANRNLYFADWGNNVVRRIDTNGVITTVAGNGAYGDTGDNGSALLATFKGPFGLAFDATGNLYISDNITHRIRKVSTSGIIITVAGDGTSGYTGDGGLATAARLNSPTHLAFGPDGSLYVADTANSHVRKITGGIISSVLINYACPNGGTSCFQPSSMDGIALDSAGNLFIAWDSLDVITRTAPDSVTRVIAGTGILGFGGDGADALGAGFAFPSGLSIDASGDLYVADRYNNRVRKLALNTPVSFVPASGSGQSGIVGLPLPSPLVAAIQFRAGVGIAGINVAFAVTSGSATLSAATTKTDALGMAGVAVTLGTTPGPIVITATTAGMPPIQFNVIAVSGVPVPTISVGGIVGAGGSIPAVTTLSPGGFATIFGVNFAPAGTFAEAPAGNWPTTLGGVCVQVNGVPAYVTFVSPGQINIQAPDLPAGTTVAVQVISNCGASNELKSATQPIATAGATPEFLYWQKNADGKNPVIAVDAITGAYIGSPGLIPGLTLIPAKAGDILTIYGVSFGATNPASVPGIPNTGIASLIYVPSVKLGTVDLAPADILYAGISPGTAGLYQLNIRVPAGLAAGDYRLVLSFGPFSTPVGGYLTVKN